MTSPNESRDIGEHAVRYLGRVKFSPIQEDCHQFRALLPDTGTKRLWILLQFDGKDYPLERHFVYARHKGEETPLTFSNMEFHNDTPGQLVGPWPGWRGIPPFPDIILSAQGNAARVTLMPWGDELASRTIRGGATFDRTPAGELLCHVADEHLRPEYADLYSCPSVRAEPVAVTLLPELVGIHPRLLVTRSQIAELGARARGSHRKLWTRIIELLENASLPWQITSESKTLPGPERLRADDRALMTAFVALVDPSQAHCSNAKAALTEFSRETRRSDYQPLSIDTQAGETLFVLAVCFDWTYGLWSDEERKELQEWLWRVADLCWGHLGYERRDYGQAHFLGCALGLLAFSFLFWEEHPRAHEWAGYCRGVLNRVIGMLPQDGFFPHGINLWIYEYGFLLRWLELFRVASGEDLWHATQHWLSASRFRGAATSPGGGYGITFGDPQYRVGGDSWCHYLIAARTGSPDAQHLGNLLLEGSHEGIDFRSIPPRRRVYEFLYFDPAIPEEQPKETVHTFNDGGQVFIRTSGSRPSLFTFRAGPPLGQQRYGAGEHGAYGHADPANGSFLIYLGDTPVLCGPGPTYRRDTSLHNTLTIDGRGQVGDSAVWLPDFMPPHVLCPTAQVREHAGRVSISSILSPVYLPYLEVQRCHRSLWVDPGRCIIGIDTIRCRSEHSIEWNIHSPLISHSRRQPTPLTFKLADSATFCELTVFDPPNAAFETGLTELVPAYPNDGMRFSYLQLSTKAKEARYAWCLILDPDLKRPHYYVANRQVHFQYENGTLLVLRDNFLTESS